MKEEVHGTTSNNIKAYLHTQRLLPITITLDYITTSGFSPEGKWRQGGYALQAGYVMRATLRLKGWLRNARYAFMLARYALISIVQTYCTRSYVVTYVHVCTRHDRARAMPRSTIGPRV